jgi:hypothetical protein
MQNLTSLLCAALFTVGLIACGGDDGPSDGTKLTSLSAAEIKSVCLDIAADFPERTVDCGGGVTLTVGLSAAECDTITVPAAACTATVGDVRSCTGGVQSAADADICSDTFTPPASCAALENC